MKDLSPRFTSLLVTFILFATIGLTAQTTIYLPDEVAGGPALILNDGDPVPDGYSAAIDQDCAQQIIDADPYCIETNWDGICQDAYDGCILTNCPNIVCLPTVLAAGPAVLICEGDPFPTDYLPALDQVCAQQIVTENPECLTLLWDTPCLNAYNECQGILPTCDDGIMNGEEIGVDCGGPDCPECDFLIMGQVPDSVSTCSTTIFDNGFMGNYANNSDDVLTVCSDTPGECIQAAFVFFDVENIIFDQLDVYAGSSMDAPLIGSYGGTAPPPDLLNPGSDCLTFHFTSDGSVTPSGFEIEITCACPTCDDGILNGQEVDTDCGGPDCPECDFNVISEEITVTSCAVQLFDSGINSDYGNNEDYTMTFCSDGSGSCLELDFTSIDIAAGDHLYIYDGPDTSGALLQDLTATQSQETIVAPTGCVTLNFTSDGFTTAGGFDIAVSCTDICPTCDDGIQNGYEIGVDCGGPDCPECSFIIMGGEQSSTTCSTTIYDNGFDGDYAANSNDVLTVCSDNPGECIQAEFISFQIEGEPFDTFTVYAGPDTDSPIVGVYGDADPPEFINAGTECLTFQFISDGSVQQAGYEIEISCACPTCDDGIQNGEEIGVDCGGPECPECTGTEQDCIGANAVCSEIYVQEDYDPDPGLFPIILPAEACLDNADNAIWYTFTVQESGFLSFVLTPQQVTDDYDWGLFDLTDADCEDIPNNPDLLVSCNSYGELGVNGPTGISTINGGVGDVNGPGDLNGPPFNADYAVEAGETFALLVQNWTGSNDGYTLDFSSSTAELFEAIGPDLESVEFVNCGNLLVDFATPVDCETLDSDDFLIESDNQVYTVDSIVSDCGSTNEVSSIELFVSPAFPDTPDSVSISFTPGDGVVQDLCGNPVPTDTVYQFITPQWIFLETSVINTTCNLDLGSISIDEIVGGVSPYQVSFDGAITTDSVFTSLTTGIYTILVVDDIGCQLIQEISVGSDFLTSELDTLIIDNCATVVLDFSADIDCSSLSTGTFDIYSSSQNYSVVSISSDCMDGLGQSFELSVTPLFPDYPDTIFISMNGILDLCGDEIPVDTLYEFITPQFISIATDVVSTECLSFIGSVELLNVFGTTGSYDVTFDEEAVAQDFLVSGLGLGSYPIEITDTLGCHLLQNAIIGTDIEEVEILMPNVFSPNGDDLNELFGPEALRIADGVSNGLIDVNTDFSLYDLKVFNRWGSLVFESSKSKKFWDGTDTGGDAAEGTYYYIVEYREACTVEESKKETVKGFLNLFR